MRTALEAASVLSAMGAAIVTAMHLDGFAADQGFEGRSRGYKGQMALALALFLSFVGCRVALRCLFP